jgi:molybdate transport system permease protein
MIDAQALAAITLSIKLAATVTVILLILGLPLAWWLARKHSISRSLIHALVALPLVLPPTVLGFYFLLFMGPSGPLGELTNRIGIGNLTFTYWGLVLGSTVYSLPFVIQPLYASFMSLPRGLLEAASSMRASPFDQFISIILPLCTPGLWTAAILSFAHTIGEFGVVLMIGGNIPGETRVVSVEIYDLVEALEYDKAHTLSLALLGFSFCVLFCLYFFRQNKHASHTNTVF